MEIQIETNPALASLQPAVEDQGALFHLLLITAFLAAFGLYLQEVLCTWLSDCPISVRIATFACCLPDISTESPLECGALLGFVMQAGRISGLPADPRRKVPKLAAAGRWRGAVRLADETGGADDSLLTAAVEAIAAQLRQVIVEHDQTLLPSYMWGSFVFCLVFERG